jgi:hypothetical protein
MKPNHIPVSAIGRGLTTGYEHQTDPRLIAARLQSLSFPDHFFTQLLLGQGMLLLLLLCIALKRLRYAAYLFAAAATMAIVALAAGVTDVGLLVGETLPFYATIFLLAWNGALPVHLSGKAAIADARSPTSSAIPQPGCSGAYEDSVG